MLRSSIHLLLTTLTVLTVGGMTRDLWAQDAPTCKRVEGHLEEALLPGSACTSVVGLCTIARMFGHLKGEARFTASAFIPSADTPTTNVVFVTGDTLVVNAQLEDRHGTLIVKNAAAYHTVGDGELVDNQTIIGGTGDLAGASGSIRISGNFLADTGGTSRFEGTVCVP
jgi:hypothetical protein